MLEDLLGNSFLKTLLAHFFAGWCEAEEQPRFDLQASKAPHNSVFYLIACSNSKTHYSASCAKSLDLPGKLRLSQLQVAVGKLKATLTANFGWSFEIADLLADDDEYAPTLVE